VSHTLLRFAKIGAVVCLALSGWYLLREVMEMIEFHAWVHEVQAGPMPKPVPTAGPEETFALNMMSVVNGRLCGLARKYEPGEPGPPGGLTRKSSSDQLHDPSGACASFSHVLTKCLLTAGIEVRKVGLEHHGVKALHHVIEAKLDGRWALLDPLFSQSFRARDGHLADARAVGQDWAFFNRQLTAIYDRRFDYSGFYHTNWDRIPVIGWLVKRTPGLEAELERRGVSARMWVLNINRWLSGMFLLASLVLWRWSLRVRAGIPFLHE